MVMKPFSMPIVSLRALATGAKQFVVQEPTEITSSLALISWWLTW